MSACVGCSISYIYFVETYGKYCSKKNDLGSAPLTSLYGASNSSYRNVCIKVVRPLHDAYLR